MRRVPQAHRDKWFLRTGSYRALFGTAASLATRRFFFPLFSARQTFLPCDGASCRSCLQLRGATQALLLRFLHVSFFLNHSRDRTGSSVSVHVDQVETAYSRPLLQGIFCPFVLKLSEMQNARTRQAIIGILSTVPRTRRKKVADLEKSVRLFIQLLKRHARRRKSTRSLRKRPLQSYAVVKNWTHCQNRRLDLQTRIDPS